MPRPSVDKNRVFCMPLSRAISRTLTIVCVATAAGCQAPPPAAPQPEYRPMATVKDLMTDVIDPNADGVWEAVGTIATPEGIEERAPKTDEEWQAVRRHAIALIEAANLLLIPGRPIARAHEKSVAPGVELEPAEIQALLDK